MTSMEHGQLYCMQSYILFNFADVFLISRGKTKVSKLTEKLFLPMLRLNRLFSFSHCLQNSWSKGNHTLLTQHILLQIYSYPNYLKLSQNSFCETFEYQYYRLFYRSLEEKDSYVQLMFLWWLKCKGKAFFYYFVYRSSFWNGLRVKLKCARKPPLIRLVCVRNCLWSD